MGNVLFVMFGPWGCRGSVQTSQAVDYARKNGKNTGGYASSFPAYLNVV
jgi:hypothetical protein